MMEAKRLRRMGLLFSVLIMGTCMAGLVSAANGTVTIGYVGAGGYYIGDTINFNGKNTAGNMTVVKVTGPGLPIAGVPLYDVTGTPGTGNNVPVDGNNDWFFSWDTNRMTGNSLMQTARYTFTAYDKAHPEISATTSVMLKRPEFYIVADRNPAGPGDYVQLVGFAEDGISYVKIDVTDDAGTIVRTFMSPVGSSGYFQYGFHADVQPGQYYIVVSNPAMKSGLRQGLIIAVPVASNVTGQITAQESVTATTSVAVSTSTTPAPAPISPLTAVAAVTGAALLLWSTGRKDR